MKAVIVSPDTGNVTILAQELERREVQHWAIVNHLSPIPVLIDSISYLPVPREIVVRVASMVHIGKIYHIGTEDVFESPEEARDALANRTEATIAEHKQKIKE